MVISSGTADGPVPSEIAAHPLPAQLTTFVGREREIVAVQQNLARTRLLTLTGAGGSGKTRLALQVAERAMATYPHGVRWIDLSALVNSKLVT